MPVSTSLHQDGSQERPVSLTSTASSSGSSRDSRGAMEEPSGPEAFTKNGAGSPRGRHAPNSNNNSSTRPNKKGPLSPFNSRAAAAPAHKLSYLGRVVREIVETERMYVQDLRSIVEDYLLKIIDTPGLLQPEQVSALFGNIESIYALNSQLLRDLDNCNSDPVAVASCFVERSQEFDIYTQYCNNYPNSVAALTECMRDKQQAKFFRDRQALLQHSLPLGSYLLKPVQRILKYHLLLQEIAKHFDEEEDGFEVVEDAIDTMTCVAWYINDMKRRHEHAVRLQEIQSLLINWKGPDLTIYGELVLEGTFRLHRVRNEKTFFLFDKALLITKKRGDHFVYKGHIPCSSLMLIESTRDSLCFTVTHYKHSKQQYSIQAKTVQEKRNWTHHIKRLILENHHTTIPQKAKEAILEMDSYYPNRYRYSPERLKKAWSSQDEVSTHVRQGRRQSEPTKHLLRQLSEKATRAARAAGMKHAGSAGTLLDCGQPSRTRTRGLQPAQGDLLLGDMGQGIPFKPGSFDGCISISAVQWLCNANKKSDIPAKRLYCFFSSLYSVLVRGARAVLQLYPENSEQLELITTQAIRAGFTGGVVVDYPNSAKAKKFYLCLFSGPSTFLPKGLNEIKEEEEAKESTFTNKRVPHRIARSGVVRKMKTREWVLEKKERRRRQGKEVRPDTQYTGRKRKPYF